MARTLYTPVLYTNTPGSNTSNSTTSTPRRPPTAYLDYLSRTHIALAQIVEEAPGSQHVSPLYGDDPTPDSSDIRISQQALALRKQVQEAFDNAGGEPADGNWGAMVQLLRLGVTRGRYRWVGARRDASRPESNNGWINAHNETEWFDWERQKQDEERVKQKVESWKKAVDVEAVPPSDLDPMDASIISINDTSDGPRVGGLRENAQTVTISATRALQRVKATAKSAGNRRNPKDPSPLGFTVAKRSNVLEKPQTPMSLGHSRDGAPVSSTPSVKSTPMRQELSTDASVIKPDVRPLITDVPETSFLPPSFPPQLATSTPVPQAEGSRQKPLPILLNSSPPLFLPQSPNMFDSHTNDDFSSSQPPPVTSPTTRLNPIVSTRNGKRPQISVGDRSPKRVRTDAQMEAYPADSRAPPSSTPLAVEIPDTVPVTPKPKRPPTLTELLASSAHSTKPGKSTPSPKLIIRPLPKRTDLDQRFHDVNPAMHGAQAVGAATEQSQHGHDGIISVPFEPMFTSTQQPHGSQASTPSHRIAGIPRIGSVGWLGYNSQVDVDGQIEEVTRFMEKDVDCDQWLNADPNSGG